MPSSRSSGTRQTIGSGSSCESCESGEVDLFVVYFLATICLICICCFCCYQCICNDAIDDVTACCSCPSAPTACCACSYAPSSPPRRGVEPWTCNKCSCVNTFERKNCQKCLLSRAQSDLISKCSTADNDAKPGDDNQSVAHFSYHNSPAAPFVYPPSNIIRVEQYPLHGDFSDEGH